MGFGDFEVGARYTWSEVGSPYTHLALAFDAGFPTGNAQLSLGEGTYTVSPSVLLSHEFQSGIYQLFTTTGIELVVASHNVPSADYPHHSLFSDSGVSRRVGHGWIVGEFSAASTSWSSFSTATPYINQ
jgi:hypothetical protein